MRTIKNYNTFINESYSIEKPGKVTEPVNIGAFGPEFDTWMSDTSAKAKSMNWESWGYTYGSIDADPKQQSIYFMVSETPTTKISERTQKGEFRLDTKKGTITE